MRQVSSKQQSITSFARDRARSLALKISIVGAMGTFLLGLGFGAYYYQGQVSQTVKVVSNSLGQPIAFGGDYLPTQIVRTLVESSNFKDAWITLPDGSVLIEEHALEEGPVLSEIHGRLFYWFGGVPHALVSRPIYYHDTQVGRLHVGYKIPVGTIFLFAFGTCLLFSIIATYLYCRILGLAKKVATPIREYSSALDQRDDKERFLKEENSLSHFSEIAKLNEILLRYIKASKESEILARKAVSKAQISKITSRVKHDVIASLVVGESVLDKLQGSGQQLGILKSVFERISNTVEDIPKIGELTSDEMDSAARGIEATGDPQEKIRSCHIIAFIHQIVGEVKFSNLCKDKDIQFEVHCGGESFHAFCEVEPNKLKRDLLNLYKNAIEAISHSGLVSTSLNLKDDNVIIKIQDNGQGIPIDILQKVGVRGFTFGKENGSGIGLASAIDDVRSWRGDLQIFSTEGNGTTIQISLPQAEESFLFPTNISLSPDMNIVVIDDDPLVHKLWKNRFSKLDLNNHSIEVHYASDLKQAKVTIGKLRDIGQDFVLLIDNDLKDSELTGLDFVKEMELESQSILVTSNGNSSWLYKECVKINIPILPKAIQEQVPIDVCQ